ncbi:membrane protein [Mycolicibacterium phlei DSM 43239 = CCUG 21000]|uniref:Membrane protein n=1 Tax=Mycolicibacterium phlei DSM 43239 = CCUG 21000 TaxID=1226750 RepID=A0A5N5V5P0_MYCPH|nr:flagellar motor control protein ZomB [Mycolicibacterium phlei]KAB7757231.1 membrane protein [Mycolicibacterium phlei DSM 43239 = CCUG 21000]
MPPSSSADVKPPSAGWIAGIGQRLGGGGVFFFFFFFFLPENARGGGGREGRGRGGGRPPPFRYDVTVRASLWVSVVVVAVLFGWGAWQRRWIADDGLIVLRTVRNLLAGNGPVFNAGERVEANTSTVWTYLVYLGALVGGSVRLEYVVLVLALALSVLGVALAMLGTGRLYAPSLQGRRALILPAGALVYIAVPPARDFATSGLENGLVLAYLGLLWWMMVCWSQRRPDTTERTTGTFDAALAFVAGLSVLVRPELALVGVLALVMMLIATRSWRRRVLIVVAGGLLPVGYQIFRMGYYGLLVPNTAIAKDATGSKWSQGLLYLANFNQPYLLWAPAVLLIGLAAVVWVSRGRPRPRRVVVTEQGWLARMVQSPAAVVAFIVVSGLLQAVYWVRQGGDFMHGRVLLAPLFMLLMPVAVIPVVPPDGTRMARGAGYLFVGATVLLWAAVAGWSLWAANSKGMGADATRVTASGIVDERRFYAQATGHAHPLTAADYLDYPRMRAILRTIDNTPDGALLLPSGNYDQWDVVPALPPPPDAGPGYRGPHTVFFTNLGMTGMNLGLDVRVIDQIGLANPLAAHTARIEDGRIGHDKNLFPDWAIAEGPFLKERPFIPGYIDEEWVRQAQEALTCPATDAMLNAVRAPMGPRRFLSNLVHSYQLTKYRIDRVPLYDLIRCGLPVPEPKEAPYTGMPATGP